MRSREKPGGKVPSTDVPSSPPIRKSLSKRKNGARCRQESMAGHTEGPQKKASPILAPNNTPCSGLTPVASGAPSVSGISAIMDPLRRELSRPAPESSRPRKGQLTKAKMNKSPYHSSPSLLLKRAMTLRSPKKMLGTAEKTPQSAVGKAIQTRAKMGGTVPSTNTPSSPPIRKSPAEKKSSPQSRQVKPAGHTKGLHPRALPGWAPNKTTCPSLAPTTSEAPSVSPIPAITCPFRRELSRPAPDSITARKQQLARSKMNKAPTHSIPSPVSRRHITLRLPKKKAGTEEKTLQAAAGPAMRTRAKTRGKVLSTDTPRSPSIQKSPSKDYNGPQSWQEKLEGYTEGPHIRTSSASPLPGQEMQEKLEGYTKGPHIRTSSTSGQEGEENLEGYTKGPHIRTSSATAHPGQEGEEKLEGYTKGPHIRTSSASAHPGQQGPEEARQDAQSMQLPNNNQEEQKDNVWNDQNLEPDPHLPPGWRTIRDTSGTYYWHVPSGTTQWQHPVCDSSEESAPMLQEVILQDTVWTPRATAAYSFLTFSKGLQYRTAYQLPPERPYPRPVQALNRSTSLSWPDEDLFQDPNEPGSTCFAVRSLGWVEIPEEDLACGKSGITVNNCIQQITNSHHAGQEGQNMVMILKKDTMSLVDPLDHSLIHSQPILNIRVWGVGCNNGRDFAFVANDKDTCMLKCHVFRCDVPAKAIASALHTMCSQMISEKATSSNSMTRSVTMETISPEDFPLQVDILDAVRQSIQRYDTLYVGRRPVSKPMGIEVLNEMIEKLTTTTDRERWKQGVMEVSDTVVAVHPPEGDDDDDLIWDCQVRYVTFIGVGKDPRTFAMIVDVGNQQFQCTVFWCEPDAGHISEAVQAACMVQYQKCLVASSSRAKASSSARSFLKMKRTASVDSPISPFTSAGHPLQKGLGSSRKRGMKAIFEAFKQKHSMMHTP